jgi:hypothetical protein
VVEARLGPRNTESSRLGFGALTGNFSLTLFFA